jgi:predicted PurR-regulated permease PerM
MAGPQGSRSHPVTLATATPARLGLVLFGFAMAVRFFDVLARTVLIAYAAACLAVVLNTVVRRIPVERKWATGGVGATLLLALGAAVWFGGTLLIDQLRDLVNELPRIQAQLAEWTESFRQRTGIRIDALNNAAYEALGTFASGGGGVLTRVRGVIGAIALVLLVLFGGLFALAKPNDRLLDPLMRTVPVDHHESVRRALDLLGHRLVGWIQGKLLAMLAVGTLSFLLFSLLGVPYALLLAVFNGLIEFIPIIGPWIGGGVAVTVAAVADPTKGLLTATAAVAIQIAENTIITPLAMQNRAKVHPFVTLLALLLFGALFGLLGVLLAIPLVLLVWTLVEVFWVDRRLHLRDGRIEPVVEE